MSATLVVVEDEIEILGLLCDMLAMDGYRVLGLRHPDAVRTLADDGVDLFLIDLMLPGASGIDVARMITHGINARAPRVALSASRLMLSQARETGLFQALIAKPFDISTLLNTVEELVTHAALT